ncbi:MAG: O-antigen ligase family protein [Thermoanaerobaculia bacterium]|nr:O-antigen ligase family protein [Thermoanaerobaculia bacterium]
MARRRTTPKAPASALPSTERVAAFVLAAGLLASGLIVDTGAESAFDAPKRLAAIVAAGLAAALVGAFVQPDRIRSAWQGASRELRLSVACFGLALLGTIVSALLAPRRLEALASGRGTLILALVAPLAALLFDARGVRRMLGCFVAVAAVNSFVSLVQRAGVWRPFEIERIAGRTEAVGLLGNEGFLALVAALGAIAAAALWLDARGGGARALLAAGAVLNAAAVFANASLTSMLTLGAGAIVLAIPRVSKRTLAIGAIAVLAITAIAFAALPQLRKRASDARTLVAAGQFDALTSYRVGAWAAAGEMIASRPLAGFGPGSFASQFVPQRIEAEKRWGRRFANPYLLGGSYEEAHCDYLQSAAEAGLVATILFALSAVLVAWALLRAVRDSGRATRAEGWMLAALAIALAVAALTWFPMQRPVTALLALVLLGRAWALAAEAAQEHA